MRPAEVEAKCACVHAHNLLPRMAETPVWVLGGKCERATLPRTLVGLFKLCYYVKFNSKQFQCRSPKTSKFVRSALSSWHDNTIVVVVVIIIIIIISSSSSSNTKIVSILILLLILILLVLNLERPRGGEGSNGPGPIGFSDLKFEAFKQSK